jgi:hypothetical protein
VRRSGEDRKWRELATLLEAIFTPAAVAPRMAEDARPYRVGDPPRPTPSPRQKLVIFTEHVHAGPFANIAHGNSSIVADLREP